MKSKRLRKKATRKALEERALLLETLLNELPLPVFAKNGDARFCFFNQAYEQFFETRREELLGKTVLDFDDLPVEERQYYQEEDLIAMRKGSEVHYETQYPNRASDRPSLCLSKGFMISKSGKRGLIGTIVDFSIIKGLEARLKTEVRELKRIQAQLIVTSRTDALTGVYNRRIFEDLLPSAMDFATIHGQPLSVILTDLDDFKRVNDHFGHDAGDKVLKAFAAILKDATRSNDIVCRLGGDEFLIILPSCKEELATFLAKHISQDTSTSITLPDGSPVTLSCGVAKYVPGETCEELLCKVDKALYASKNKGRNCVSSACCCKHCSHSGSSHN